MTKKNVFILLTILFSVCLQIQISLFTTSDYAGLRINLGDFFIPIIGLGVLVSLLFKKTAWPRWDVKHFYLWLLGLVLVLSISLVQGYYTNGFLSNWAFINKYIGFFILLSYLALGGWIETNRYVQNAGDIFVKYFCAFFTLVLLASFCAIIIEKFLPVSLWIGDYAWDGFMANRNAFMLAAVFVMIALETYRQDDQNLIPQWVYALFWMMVPFFAFFNASRAGWIVAAVILLCVVVKRPLLTIKRLLPFLLIGLVLCSFCVTYLNMNNSRSAQQLTRLGDVVKDQSLDYAGDQKRIIDVQDGLALYKTSNPIIGAGLGVYTEYDLPHRSDRYAYIIDFTALWLLVETGLLGLGIFSAFFLVCAWHFYKRSFSTEASLFHRTLFFFLIAFAALSFLHEITYTRFLWMIMGMALVTHKEKAPKGAV